MELALHPVHHTALLATAAGDIYTVYLYATVRKIEFLHLSNTEANHVASDCWVGFGLVWGANA